MATKDSKLESQVRDRQQLAKLIEEQKRSGLSIAAFARKEGVPVWKLYHALRPRRKRRPEFVEVSVRQKEEDAPRLELVLPGALRVHIPKGFDEITLRRLVEALTPC